MPRHALFLAVLVPAAACVMQTPQQEQELRTRAPGHYAATAPDGTRLELVLNADGTGNVNGQPGTWNIQYGRIFLSDGKQTAPADLSGDQLTVYLPDGQVVFTRVGGQPAAASGGVAQAGGAAAAQPARPFAPEKTLPGKSITTTWGASFTAPDGFGAPAGGDNGVDSYTLNETAAAGKTPAGIVVSRRVMTAAERQSPVATVLQQALAAQLGQQKVETVVPAENLEVGGQRAGRVIVKMTANGATYEVYLAGVVVEPFGFVIGASYQATDAARLRPAVDTVLATFRGAVPAENSELKGKLAGCWENFMSSGGGSGSGSSTTRLALAADGSFQYRAFTSVSVQGMGSQSDTRAAGTWRVEGQTLHTIASEGEGGTYSVSFQGGILYLNGNKYLPCSG